MLTGIQISPDAYEFIDNPFPGTNGGGVNPPTSIAEAIYSSDEFRMYAFKIRRCTRTRSHDWTECPFAHRGEKARRRDPSKYNYIAIACPSFRTGECKRGDACGFAHGVFEYWLHPAKYRTRACNAGRFCQRKVCFFAHTSEELRSETKYRWHYTYRARPRVGGSGGGFNDGDLINIGSGSVGENSTAMSGQMVESKMESEFLNSLRELKISDGGDEGGENKFGWDISESDLPNIDWISDLVQ